MKDNAPKKTDPADKVEPTADAGGIVAKCGSCAASQPVTHKCCSECGTQMAQAARTEYQAALDGLGDFHKAQTGLAPQTEVVPGDHGATRDVITKARSAAGADPNEIATVELLLGGQNGNTDLLVALLGDVRAGRLAVGEMAGFIHKAISAGFKAHEEVYTTAIAALTARVDEWESSPGRARTVGLRPVLKAASVAQQDPEQDDSLRGDVLIKAAVRLGTERKLDPVDVTLTQQYVNAGHSLKTIEAADPALFQRLSGAGLGVAA